MPIPSTSKMNPRLRCGVMVERKKWTGEEVTEPCGQTRAAHRKTLSIKKKGEDAGKRTIRPPKITDHKFADPTHVPVECQACGDPIPIGEEYRWWRSRNRGQVNRHLKCGYPPRAYWTNSEILASAWAIADDPVPDFETPDDFESWANEIAEQIEEELVASIQEKIDNVEQYFTGGSPIIDELDERRSMYEQWADEVRDAASEFSGRDGTDEDEDMNDLLAEMTDRANDLLGACPE